MTTDPFEEVSDSEFTIRGPVCSEGHPPLRYLSTGLCCYCYRPPTPRLHGERPEEEIRRDLARMLESSYLTQAARWGFDPYATTSPQFPSSKPTRGS